MPWVLITDEREGGRSTTTAKRVQRGPGGAIFPPRWGPHNGATLAYVDSRTPSGQRGQLSADNETRRLFP